MDVPEELLPALVPVALPVLVVDRLELVELVPKLPLAAELIADSALDSALADSVGMTLERVIVPTTPFVCDLEAEP